MGLFTLFKKERKEALPPPPPPTMEGLPPLPSLELEVPPAPAMPTPPKPEELPMELPPLPQFEPRAIERDVEIPVVKAEELEMPSEETASPFIEDSEPTVVHDKTLTQPYKETIPQPPRHVKPVIHKEEGSAFVSVGDYETIMGSIGTIQQNIEETEQHLTRMTELSNTEEKVLEQWRNHLEDMEKKLSYVDQVIFEGE